MSSGSQKEAVITAIVSVLTNAGIVFEEGVTIVKNHMTKELRAQVNQILFEGFRNGSIELDVEKSDAELKAYVSGLQSNWLNRAKELNGGMAFIAKNPGSRTGMTDPQVKALRTLLANTDSEEEKAEIQSYLDARLNALGQNKKAKKTTINFNDLPEELRKKYEIAETSEEA